MSWMLHTVSLCKAVSSIGVNFPTAVERFFILHVITSSNHINFVVGTVNELEVVREGYIGSCLVNGDLLRAQVDV